MTRTPLASRSSLALGAALVVLGSAGCASRNYTYYLVEPDTKSKSVLEEEDTLQRPFTYGTSTVMKVRWNDGEVLTEVDLPLLSSGQRIVIEHASTDAPVTTLPSTRIVAPPPVAADTALIEAYRARGLRIDDGAPDVSLAKAREGVQEATRAGNYTLALEWIELVLARYPSHPEFLRAKGSVLVMMGERPRAIEVYEKAEEIESDPAVRRQLDKLQAEGN